MSWLTVGKLKEQIKDLPDNMDVFLRVVYNPCGNIELGGDAIVSTYSFFGESLPCVIIEPTKDEEDDEEPEE